MSIKEELIEKLDKEYTGNDETPYDTYFGRYCQECFEMMHDCNFSREEMLNCMKMRKFNEGL